MYMIKKIKKKKLLKNHSQRNKIMSNEQNSHSLYAWNSTKKNIQMKNFPTEYILISSIQNLTCHPTLRFYFHTLDSRL